MFSSGLKAADITLVFNKEDPLKSVLPTVSKIFERALLD